MTYLLGFFGMPGHIELLIVVFVALLLFGHRLPSVMRSLGRGVVEFKQGLAGAGGDGDDDLPEKGVSEKSKNGVSEKGNS